MSKHFLSCLALLATFVSAVTGLQAAAVETPQQTAAKLDALLTREFSGLTNAAVPKCDDATFLRRASLDLIGEVPSVEELTTFALDPSPHKRRAAIDRLLDNKLYGQNWARYWRDVIMFRRTDDRALLVSNSLVVYLTEELNKNTKWDQLARAFVTAKGDVREEGATAIIVAQMGEPADVTAEVSRIFMGVQIQCAQCHNHPTDRWKREQFHELAAFFPRIAVRPVMSATRRSFEVVGVDRQLFGGGPNNNRPGGKLEHYMPDLNDPAARGTLMQPVFFPTGQKLQTGATDQERRDTLADWLTARGNRWFAKALVNRLWSELIGQGFYEPVDDLGPDRKATAPQTFELLTAEWIANDYDVKWLFRTIVATEAYQRQSRSRNTAGDTPFVANCSQRLRADQLFNAVTAVLGIDEEQGSAGGMGGFPGRGMFNTPRGQVQQTFGYDPSMRRDEVAGSIPQALWLMNSSTTSPSTGGRFAGSGLAKLLADLNNDEDVTIELYLRTLAREPKNGEIATCLSYVKSLGNRAEAFEDIQWALLNSTEFLHRK